MKVKSVYYLGEAAEVAEFNSHFSPPTPLAARRLAPPPGAAVKCGGNAAHKCPWWPYSSSKDFTANTVVILVVLVVALFCGLALNAGIRYIRRLHRSRRNSRLPESGRDFEMTPPKTAVNSEASEMKVEVELKVYSAGMKLAGEEAECTICLSEFAGGEKIRVLDKCGHGFHVQCIQQWLAAQSSCPTCRTSCTL